MQWAYADDIWAHYKFDESTVLPAINSSVQYIEKSAKALALYKIAQDYLINNPIPLSKLRMKWGGSQPDELYMNCALAKLGLDPAVTEVGNNGKAEIGYIHFAMVRGLSFGDVTDQYYFQSYYGGKGFTPTFYIDWMDRLLKSWMKDEGKQHKYFIHRITDNKYADPRR
jgi:hypothetical protein